ncbi:MAG: hypothetical protein ACRDPV_13650 [Gaiellaceae bacterium]
MKTPQVLAISFLVAAVALTSVAAAGPEAAKQRVVITSKLVPQETFVLVPSTVGTLKRDSGTVSVDLGSSREEMRGGQKIGIFPRAVYTFDGKVGSFTVHERTEWVVILNVNTRYGYPPGVAIGTWKLVRGTGQYARLAGGGGSGHAGLGRPWLAQHEAFLAAP